MVSDFFRKSHYKYWNNTFLYTRLRFKLFNQMNKLENLTDQQTIVVDAETGERHHSFGRKLRKSSSDLKSA